VSTEPDGWHEWVATTPSGDRYAVVVAPRGTSLRGGSGATDLTSIVFEIVVEAAVAITRNNGTWKVGVLKKSKYRERFVHKATELDRQAAHADAERIVACIDRGDFSWRARAPR